MRFLANENFPAAAVKALDGAGHDIAWVRVASPGVPDSDVLAWAAREGRILLTFDKDFGEIARSASLPPSCGVIPFRMPMPPASEVGSRLAGMIAARTDWAGHFSVVETDRVRMRLLDALK